MSSSKEMWKALHSVILDELQFRGVGSGTAEALDNLADNLTNTIVANFELEPRRS